MQEGTGDVLLHHAEGNPHALGDFGLGEPVELVQDEGLPPARRQIIQRPGQVMQALVLLGLVLGAWGGMLEQRIVVLDRGRLRPSLTCWRRQWSRRRFRAIWNRKARGCAT